MYVYETKNTQFGGPVLLNFGPFQKFQRETRASCAYSVIRALCKELCYSEIYFFYSFFKLLRMWIFFKPGCEKWWKIVCHLSIGSKLPEFALPISKLRLQCSETITSASLDNVAYRETGILVRRTTKLVSGMVQCRLFRRVSFLRAVFWWANSRVWRLRGDRSSLASIRYRHPGPAHGV